jgi:hypothetical protein
MATRPVFKRNLNILYLNKAAIFKIWRTSALFKLDLNIFYLNRTAIYEYSYHFKFLYDTGKSWQKREDVRLIIKRI